MGRFFRILSLLRAVARAGLVLAGCFAGAAAVAEVVLEESFDGYEPGVVEAGGESGVNRLWFSFRGGDATSVGESRIEVAAGAGTNGSNALKLTAAMRPKTHRHFYVGARSVMRADLRGLDRGRLQLTASARLEVVNRTTRRRARLPHQFYFAFRFESERDLQRRGARQFNIVGDSSFARIGGRLSEAVSGRRYDYDELRVADGPGKYQIVIAISSCCTSAPFPKGHYDVEVLIDDVKLEIVDPAPLATTSNRFALDHCRVGRWPGGL